MRRWTPKAAVARSRKNIAGAVERIRAVALEWGDINEGFVTDADRFIKDLKEWAESIESETNERIAAGEHVGL